MKRLIAAPNLALATLWADQLSGAGMDATVQRHWAGSIAGEIPPDQALPEVWVMDETRHAEALRLLDELRNRYCIVIVTHSMQQAARVSQRTAFFHLGNLIEMGDTNQIFTNPREKRTEDYITGRFG